MVNIMLISIVFFNLWFAYVYGQADDYQATKEIHTVNSFGYDASDGIHYKKRRPILVAVPENLVIDKKRPSLVSPILDSPVVSDNKQIAGSTGVAHLEEDDEGFDDSSFHYVGSRPILGIKKPEKDEIFDDSTLHSVGGRPILGIKKPEDDESFDDSSFLSVGGRPPLGIKKPVIIQKPIESEYQVVKEVGRSGPRGHKKPIRQPDPCNIHDVTAYCGYLCWPKLKSGHHKARDTKRCMRNCVPIFKDYDCKKEPQGRSAYGAAKVKGGHLDIGVDGRSW